MWDAKARGTALVEEFRRIPKQDARVKGVQVAVSSRCTWRWQRPQQLPLTLVPLISHCTFLPLFLLHFSHVLSYVISLEPDKTPGEGFCGWGHRPGSVSGLQLLIIRSYKRLEDCMVWGTPYRIPFTPRLTWVNCTSSLPALLPHLTLPSSRKTLWYYISPKL